MCYKYKLHNYKHKQRQLQFENDTVTWSMRICPDSNIIGKVSDYLSKVSFTPNNDEEKKSDYYYIDDTHFYFVKSIDKDNYKDKNTFVELCFKDEDGDISDASIVAQTDYCIEHSINGDKLCSKDGIYVCDICGLDSIGRRNSHLPAAPIDYIPEPGTMYKFSHIQYIDYF